VRVLALALAVFASTVSAAEVVYSWRDPRSGQLHLSSVPPPWLRSADAAERGPRVNVFKDGKVVPPERVGRGGKVLDPPAPGTPGAAPASAAVKLPELPELLAKRDEILERLVVEALRVGPASANETFFIVLDRYLGEDVGRPTLDDILEELARPGRDPRPAFEPFSFGDVHAIGDLEPGMMLPGIVTNVTAFGALSFFLRRSRSSMRKSSSHQVTAAGSPRTWRSTDIGTLVIPISRASSYAAMLYL